MRNDWRWDWLDQKVDDVRVGDVFRKLDEKGAAFCVPFGKTENYGSRGFIALRCHMNRAVHKKNASAVKNNTTIAGAAPGKLDIVGSTLSPSRSYDSQLHNLVAESSTPIKQSSKKASRSVDDDLYKAHLFSTPGSSSKSRKGSVMGSLERMINMLTPKKQRGSTCEGPRKVKAVHNVFRTTEQNPEYILEVLRNTIEDMCIPYRQSDYTLRCTVMDDWGRIQLAFDLEVCAIPKSSFLGLCRKRVKGDTWHYKKLCKDIVLSSKLC